MVTAAELCDVSLTGRYYFYKVGSMESKDVVTSLSALAQESRLALFQLLVKRGPEGYMPSELSEKLEVPAPTLSFHLKELQRAGLIDVRREGRFLFYRPNFSHMNQLLEFLTANCCSLGYAVIDRAYVSEELRQSAEFRSLCPASAVCMSKALPCLRVREST